MSALPALQTLVGVSSLPDRVELCLDDVDVAAADEDDDNVVALEETAVAPVIVALPVDALPFADVTSLLLLLLLL